MSKASTSGIGMLSILFDHQARYPRLQAQDVYKLLFQAACGSAHAVINRLDARDKLQKEVDALIDPYPEPAIDPISPDGNLVRVHVSPYLAQGGDFNTLLDAFMSTGQSYPQDREKFKQFLEEAKPFVKGLEDLANGLQAHGYPAVHHSLAYHEAYKPAYRVVLQVLL
ncbi:MAG: hypothetical protein ACK2TV_13885 [Anaerolineales bacterium]